MAQGLILFSDSSRGVYIPKHFAEDVKRQYVTGIDLSELDYLLDNDYCDDNFWDHWIYVLNNCTVTDDDGNVYSLYQDGDLWLVCDELMTDEEKENFFPDY
mgnify:CR=1 FL=1